MAGALTFTALSVGAEHTCGLTRSGAAYCWGHNNFQALGDGTATDGTSADRSAPVAVTGGLTFTTLSAGGLYTCALTTAGAAYCWGFNLYGEVGDGTTTGRWAPVAVSGGLSFASLSTGYDHACAVTSAGVAYCWGVNGVGELGIGTIADGYLTTPVVAARGLAFAAFSAGGQHSCGITSAGTAYCWGQNADGELGDGNMAGPESCGSVPCSMTPAAVAGRLVFGTVSAGDRHSCGLSAAGTVYCWGSNQYAQLGNGTKVTSDVPVLVVR